MAALNLKQITDKLNEEFSGAGRRLVFWYDAEAEFAEDVDSLSLTNAGILHLEKDNQFYIKYFLERQDTTTNYLIYAPFPKPDIRENHLADTIRYSKEFFADRTSLICMDLNIPESCKPTVRQYIAFFNSKDRTQAFYALELDSYTDAVIEDAMMSVLCKSKSASFEQVLCCVLAVGTAEDNRLLKEFSKYGLDLAFWRRCESVFGYADKSPTLQKLMLSLFVTCVQKTVPAGVPAGWQPFVLYKPGSVLAFMDQLMNNRLYGKLFDAASAEVWNTLNAGDVFGELSPADLLDCTVFAGIDGILMRWITERLLQEDTDAKLNGKTIPEVCDLRRRLHFGERFEHAYQALKNAAGLIAAPAYKPVGAAAQAAKTYISGGFETDRQYRRFYYHYDLITDRTPFEALRELVENIYTNEHLNPTIANWTAVFTADHGQTGLDSQLDFFDKYVRYKKERVVVIVSDALRYEAAASLLGALQADERCEAKLGAMQSVLPSITRFGMAALLPHKTVAIDNAYTVLCDGQPCADLKQREAILRSAKPNSRCVRFDDVRNLSQAKMREILTGQDVVYVYHDQIDGRGDHPATENEVFVACKEAAAEIVKLIRDINARGNTHHFIITADHGFIYKKDKLQESDKVAGVPNAGARYVITERSVPPEGVAAIPMRSFMQNEEEDRYVWTPVGSEIFKVPGGGHNYTHGGCSPQEMIVPVIEVRAERSRVDTANAAITLVSFLNKVTNLNIKLDFLQQEPVSDTVKETAYRVFFADENGAKISNEHLWHADSTERESSKRIFTLRFTFKNQAYDRNKKYYLIAVDEKTGVETLRRQIVMDIAFAGDFGFSV